MQPRRNSNSGGKSRTMTMSLADTYSASRCFYAWPPLVHTLSPWSSLGPSETGSLGKVLVSPNIQGLHRMLRTNYPSWGQQLPPAASQKLLSALCPLVSAYTHKFPGPSPGPLLSLPQRQSQNTLEIKWKWFVECDRFSPARASGPSSCCHSPHTKGITSFTVSEGRTVKLQQV